MTTANLDKTETNRALAAEMYGAVSSGDLEKFLSFISPSVIVEEPSFLSYGGDYHGINGLKTLLGTLTAKFDLLGLNIEQIIVDGDCICAFCRVPVNGSDGSVVFVERALIKDGKVSSFRIYMFDAGNLIDPA